MMTGTCLWEICYCNYDYSVRTYVCKHYFSFFCYNQIGTFHKSEYSFMNKKKNRAKLIFLTALLSLCLTATGCLSSPIYEYLFSEEYEEESYVSPFYPDIEVPEHSEPATEEDPDYGRTTTPSPNTKLRPFMTTKNSTNIWHI